MTAKIPSTREFIFPSPHEGSGRRFQRRVMNQISEIPEARRATQSRYKFRAGFAALVFLLLIFASPTLAAEPNFPPLTGRVVDDAGILNASTQSRAHRHAGGARARNWRASRRSDLAVAARIYDRGLRLSARPLLGHRAERQEHRRDTYRCAQRAQSSYRGRLRPRRNAYRRHLQHDNPELYSAQLQARRLQRRRISRHPIRYSRCWAANQLPRT